MKASLKQGDVSLGLVAEEACPPDPGLTYGGCFWLDEYAVVAVELEFITPEAPKASLGLLKLRGNRLLWLLLGGQLYRDAEHQGSGKKRGSHLVGPGDVGCWSWGGG